jgi:hypothetical protein
MGKQINFKQNLKKVVAPRLQPLGYDLMEMPQSTGVGTFFFRKHLFEDIFGFVSFDLRRWHPAPPGAVLSPRSFRVSLLRNRGEQPKLGHGSGESIYQNWLDMSLSYLLWTVLAVKVYSGPYHEWKFLTSDELEAQLQDAVGKLLQHGIPWLEDPVSKNPYPSWPSI